MELISKEEVNRLIDKFIEKHDTEKKPLFTAFSYDIDMLPIIESRPTGTWETHKRAVLYKGAKKYVAELYHECSNCKHEAEIVQEGCWLHSKYCPNCGARMEEEE